jgi:serine protease Do
MKVLKITAITTALAGLVGLAVVLAPSVSAQSFDRLFAGAQDWSGGRELTILGGRGGELGVSIVDGKDGVEIDEVHPDSAAEKAGLKRGDVFLEFDGEHVRSTRQFTRLLHETPSGKSVRATISRDGKKQDVQLTLADSRESRVVIGGDGKLFLDDALPRKYFDSDQFRRSMREFAERLPEMERGLRGLPNFNYRFDIPGATSGGRLGVTVDELTSQLADYFGAKEGVLVTSVNGDSAAAKAGIKAGDVITAINGDRIASSADLVQSLRGAETEDVTIGIVRDKKEQTFKAKIEPRRPPRGARPV